MMGKINIKTLGCRLNTYESEALRIMSESEGLDDTTIINSCAVTSEAVKKAKKTVRKARRANPNNLIVVTGCAAQTEPKTFANMEEVDLVVGNKEKLSPTTWRNLKNRAMADQFSKIRNYLNYVYDLQFPELSSCKNCLCKRILLADI